MVKDNLETLLVQFGNEQIGENHNAVVAPIYLSTAYKHKNLNGSDEYNYARIQTPTRKALENAMTKLEGGVSSFATSSGMAAIDLTVSTFLESGDELISNMQLYGGTAHYFESLNTRGISYKKWDGNNLESLNNLISVKTKLVWLETPSNPMMTQVDLNSVIKNVKEIRDDILIVVDNTFLTPLLQRPLEMGSDLVVESATKYLGGHSDILGGIVTASDMGLADKLRKRSEVSGQVLDPFSSWLLIRSLKTLSVRMERHQKNAQILANFLKTNLNVNEVLYPGIGGMLSFYLSDQVNETKFLSNLKLASFAESLGGVETLITLPAVKTHYDLTEEERLELGITNQLVRVSVGLENIEDIIHDIKSALTQAL